MEFWATGTGGGHDFGFFKIDIADIWLIGKLIIPIKLTYACAHARSEFVLDVTSLIHFSPLISDTADSLYPSFFQHARAMCAPQTFLAARPTLPRPITTTRLASTEHRHDQTDNMHGQTDYWCAISVAATR